MPYLGGFTIVALSWLGPSALAVDIDRGDWTDKVFQLYVNRKLVAYTFTTEQTRLVGQVTSPQVSAAPLNVLAVEPADALTDFGQVFERFPWNRYQIDWTIPEGYSGDCHHFDILGATAPDTDPTVLLLRVPYHGPKSYSADLPVIPRTGNWRYAVVPRDNALPLGNAGTPVAATIAAVIYPADFALQPNGSRFSCSVNAGVLTVSFPAI